MAATSAATCVYFQNGHCLKGSNCRFTHDTKTVVCKFYSTTRGCKNGANCRFSHDGETGSTAKAVEEEEAFVIVVATDEEQDDNKKESIAENKQTTESKESKQQAEEKKIVPTQIQCIGRSGKCPVMLDYNE